MDWQGFGRALGYGTRHAAKALSEAAKAAAAPSPSEALRNSPAQRPAGRIPDFREATARAAETHRAVASAKRQVSAQAKTAGRSALAPLRRAGGVLWLEMTGCAFALFAVVLAGGAWKLRGALRAAPSSGDAQKFYLYLVVLTLFTYFAISSFVRAHRRGKRP